MSGSDDPSAATRRDMLEPIVFRPPGVLHGMRWPRLPWPTLLVTTTLLVAAAIVIYLFSVRAVELEVTPSHAEVSIAGLPTPRVGGRWLLLAGEHEVHARAEGYRPLAQSIRVTADPHQSHALVMKPLPGKLDVMVTPTLKAALFVDGLPAGEVPGVIEEVEAGAHEFVVRAPRHLDFTTRMEITGKGQTQSLTATLLPAWAEFSIASAPAGARVFNGQDLLGVTPLRGELLQGTRQISVELKGYKPWSRRIDVVAGQAVNIPDVRLQKDDGYFLVTSEPAGAAITVDGVFKGETPVRFAVAPDKAHTVAAMKTGFVPARLSHRVDSGEELAIPVKLVPELAVLELVTTPADAELLVDGVARGSASQRLELPTHEHEIIVRKPGYATYRTLITPRKGVIKRVQIRLKTAEEMARLETPASAPPTAAAPGGGTTAVSLPPAQGASPLPPQWSAEAQANADLMMNALRQAGPATSAQGLPAPGRRYTYEGRILGVECTDWTVEQIRDNGDVLSRCGEYTLQTSAAHDHNALRMVRDDGEVEIGFEPSAQAVRQPLAVGKRWSGNYKLSMRELGESLDARAECEVEAEGPVEVPAGAIPAFRIACTDHVRVGTRRVVSRSTRWFAPSLGIFVKGVNTEDPGRWNFALTGIGDAAGVAPWQAGEAATSGATAPPASPPPSSVVPTEGGIVRSSLGQELRHMPPATFLMGQTRISLQRAYYLGLREVSNAEYRRFNSAHVSRGAEGQDLDGEHLPVVNLTWEAAAAYCNWLSRRESLPPFYQIRFGRVIGINPDAVGYRLPTEAEWDFAARIAPEGETQEYAWLGAYPPRGRTGNYADESAQGFLDRYIKGYQDGFAAAAPVGSFPANLRGLHDLAGNVSEWIHDFHAELPRGEVRDPLGPADGRAHVVRGSSWAQAGAVELRLDHRAAASAPQRDLGFRLARYAE